MCGIVGLHLKDEALHHDLGEMLVPMLLAMSQRGPDSAGIALYDEREADSRLRWSLRHGADTDWDEVTERLHQDLSTEVDLRLIADDAVITLDAEPALVSKTLDEWHPEVSVVSYGHSVEVYKDVGHPATICDRYGIESRRGFQGLGHTRMATESAVTTEHSHPFSAGTDLCLVHNGSFSNYATVRRQLSYAGITFQTDNDSEVATRFLAFEIEQGADLGGALESLMDRLDGFYTLLVATETQFAVVRDAFACKPAVIAETDEYVAMASEYHALALLPDIDKATVIEPMPREVHLWTR